MFVMLVATCTTPFEARTALGDELSDDLRPPDVPLYERSRSALGLSVEYPLPSGHHVAAMDGFLTSS